LTTSLYFVVIFRYNWYILFVDAKPGTPTLVQTIKGNSGVQAIATLNDQLFVSFAGSSNVSVYNATSFQLLSQLTIPGLGARIYGLATSAQDNYLYVGDNVNCFVYRINISNPSGPGVIYWNAWSYPIGLSVNSARNVLVAYNYAKTVREYTSSGSLVRSFVDISGIYHALELANGTLAISRAGASATLPPQGIAIVSKSGQVILSYGNQSGSGIGEMKNPRHLAVDKDGYILVSDCNNNRVMVVNPSLTVGRQLLLNTSTQSPTALSYDQSRGRLYVGELSGQMRLLVFDNVTNINVWFAN